MDILDLILSNLKACHNHNDKWRYAYELIVGAAVRMKSVRNHFSKIDSVSEVGAGCRVPERKALPGCAI